MPRLSEMPAPAPLSGLELTPLLQGGGADGNVGVPVLAYGNLPRGSVLALRRPMSADLGSTAAGDPGAGKVRWNEAVLVDATEIYIDHVDAAAAALEGPLAALQAHGYLYLQGCANSDARDNWQKWKVVAVAVESGYTCVTVTLVDAAGEFAADDELELTLQQPDPLPGVDRSAVSTAPIVSGVLTIDATLGDYFVAELDDENVDDWNIVLPPGGGYGMTLRVRLVQGAVPRTVYFPSRLNWGEDVDPPTMPTAPGAVLVVYMTSDDGGEVWDVTARVRA